MESDNTAILGAATKQLEAALNNYPQFEDCAVVAITLTTDNTFDMITNVPNDLLLSMLAFAMERALGNEGKPLDAPQA